MPTRRTQHGSWRSWHIHTLWERLIGFAIFAKLWSISIPVPESCSGRASRSSIGIAARKALAFGRDAVYKETHIGSSHFLPALVTVVDPLTGIRVVFVVRRIVIEKFDVHPRALRYLQRSSVGDLPIEVFHRDDQIVGISA